MKDIIGLAEARKILGISESSAEGEVKFRYRTLAKRYHPDLAGGGKSDSMMKLLNQAYELVMKAQFGIQDVWEDYETWWYKQFGSDPIWGNSSPGEDKKRINHDKTKKG